MFNLVLRTCLSMVVTATAATAMLADAEVWVFEGLITESDPALAPHLKSGWVLSGSFLLDPLEMLEDSIAKDNRSGRLTAGIMEAELTVDLYYSLKFEALQVPGMAGLDFVDDSAEGQEGDRLGWFFPMRGKLADSDWSLRWLQVWLSDESGNMFRTLPPPIPPSGFDWDKAWFRLTFVNGAGEQKFAGGHMDFFAPQSASEGMSEEERLTGIVAELSSRLIDRDSRIASLEQELVEVRERLDSVRRMVDLLVEERTQLVSENQRLSETAAMADPGAREKLAGLESEKALLEQEVADLEDHNQALADSLGASEIDRRRLLREMDAIRAELDPQPPEEAPSKPQSRGTLESPEGKPRGVITVFEKPMVIEKPVPVPAGPASQIRPTGQPGPAVQPGPARKFGPRKFR